MMRTVLRYVVARLGEPGTMRSLVWVVLSFAGYQVTDDAVAEVALMASMALGLASAARPESK